MSEYKTLRTVALEIQEAAAAGYKTLRTIALEIQEAAGYKPGETWKTASGKIGAKNKDGVVDYFEDEDSAKAWISGQFKPAGRADQPGDTSVPVELDRDGYEVQKTAGGSPANAKPTAAAATRPTPQPARGAAPQAQAAASNTQRAAQPQGSQAGAGQQAAEDPEVEAVKGENPQSQYDAPEGTGETTKNTPGFRKTGKKAKFRSEEDKAKSVRKSKLIASAIKGGEMQGPKKDSESLTGNAEAERAYVAELNHAALSSGMGDDIIDHEPCSKMFAALGFCHDQSGKEVDKGIKRPEMPQLSGIVDTDRTDSVAYKKALQQAQRKKAAKDKFKTNDPTKDQLKDVSDEEAAAAQPSAEDIGREEVNFEEQFIEALKNAGYEVEETEVNPSTLKPIQTEMQGSKIAGMYSTIAAAELDPKTYGKEAERLKAPIFTSGGYVIDGHHRWAAMIGADMANGRGADMRMKTRNIKKGGKDVDIDEMVAFSNAFQHAMGIINQDRDSKPVRKNFSDQELKTSEQIAKGLGIKENKPQAKTQKEWAMGNFKSTRIGRLVSTLNESAAQRLQERITGLGRPKRSKSKSGKIVHDPDTKFKGAMKPLAGAPAPKKGSDPKAAKAREASVANKMFTAQDLINTALSKHTGTTIEFFGSRGGKEYSVKFKVALKNGVSTLLTLGGKPVRLEAGAQGLRVIEDDPYARNPRVIMDNGTDMIWESADHTDVGMMQLHELRKLSDAELGK